MAMTDSNITPKTTDFLGFELVTGHKPVEGSECAIQTLYEGDSKCTCCKNWVEQYPEDIRAQIEEQPETKQKALIVRMRRSHMEREGTSKPLVLDSVVVQSESLKTTLGEVFQGYKGITASLKRLVFKSPFHPFHYRWQRFTQILERQKVEDPVAASYSQILHDLLRSELNHVMSEIEDLTNNGVITYGLLWALFEPGEHVITSKDGQERIYVIESSDYITNEKVHHLNIKTRYIDYNGEHLGYTASNLKINKFQGTRSISELNACPPAFHPRKEELIARLIARGKKFYDMCGVQCKAYDGNVRYNDGKKQTIRKVDGRVMLDAAKYFQEMSSSRLKLTLTPLDAELNMPEITVADDTHGSKLSSNSGNGQPDQNAYEATGSRSDPSTKKGLTDKEYILCGAWVRGFSLKQNRWGRFAVENISDVSWNAGVFDALMLPEGYKDLILSFIEAQEPGQERIFDDIVEGKGLGTIVLMAGNPGTGKTLTAEAVADYVRRPLYMLNVGELGTKAKDVESRLQMVLELTEKWNAILLFDECDVFMQKRATDNLVHNEIVAVALRVLEYYRGILFMTSNRSEMIDRAFESRIHLILNYPDLTPESKEHIWRQLARRSGIEVTLTDDDFARLKQLPMNGRQIKNAIKNAIMLANRHKKELSVGYIKTVLAATQSMDVSGI